MYHDCKKSRYFDVSVPLFRQMDSMSQTDFHSSGYCPYKYNEDYILQVILNGTICLPAPVTDREETQFRQEHRIQMDILRKPETRPNKHNFMKI